MIRTINNEIQLLFTDRLDRKFHIYAKPNEHIASVLNRNHIPIDSVIIKKDGEVIDDWQEQIDPVSKYQIEMVRAYHLPDLLSLLRLWDTPISQGKWKVREDSYYTKRFFMHNNNNGDYQATQSSFNKQEFIHYIETLFADGIVKEGLINESERFALAMSGGRDSLSLGYLLNRSKEMLPAFEILSIHVGSFAKPKDTNYAKEISEKFGFEHRFVSDAEVKKIYRLKVSPQEALEVIKYKHNKSYSIGSVHAVMRGAVENVAEQEGISKIAYGLMCEDLMASIFKGKFIGMPFTGPYKKKYGHFDLIYPLWPITKKELTLYLEAVVPEHNRQGSPTEFDRGALSRDIFYLIVDTLETILPGAAMQLFKAHDHEQKVFHKELEYKTCCNCKSQYCTSYIKSQEKRVKGVCDLCDLFEKYSLIQ